MNGFDEFSISEEMEENVEEFNGLQKTSYRGLRRKNNFKKALRNRSIAESITGCYTTSVQGHNKEVVQLKRRTLFRKSLNEYSKNKAYEPCKRVQGGAKASDIKKLMSADEQIYEFGIISYC